MKTSDVEPLGTPSNTVRDTANQDGAVLLDIRQGLCFSINPVGSKIWQMIKQQHSLNEVVDTLAQEFSVPKERIHEDVVEFTSMLTANGLLVARDKSCQQKPVRQS